MVREIHEADARDIADSIRSGDVKATEVLDHCLERIERINPALNAFVFLDAERARAAAASVDERVAAGDDPGPLAGVPLAVKELEPVEGWPDTRASTYFKDRVATQTSTMTSRLLDAGAVPVGLTASPEIGHLPFTNSVLHGPTRNPWAPDRTPGGSSGGAGAALAAGLVPLATGSDMGGSIRLPAGWCGVVGFKGTLGRIPRGPGYLGFGHLTHYGPLARSVGDAARYVDCTAGVDQRDPTSLPVPDVPFERAIEELSLAGRRVAVVDDIGLSPSHPDVAAALRATADALIAAGGLDERAVTIDLPDFTPGAAALMYADTDPVIAAGMGEIMGNLFATEGAAELLAAAYAGAEVTIDALALCNQTRHELNMRLADAFDEVDLILLPTSPVPAFGCAGPLPTSVAGREVGPTACALFTSPFNLSGNPVISVPMGVVDGAPVGMQIVGRRHDDASVLAAGALLERARPWPRVAPDPAPAGQ